MLCYFKRVLDQVNPHHLLHLSQGAGAWNAWRKQEPNVRPDLINAKLKGANLSGMDLSGSLLSLANLWEAGLSGAILVDCGLSGAVLVEADLSGANLQGANLAGARLLQANLSGANLKGANLAGATLQGANVSGANLQGANLAGASLLRANFSGATMLGTNLAGADAREADFTGADLTGALTAGTQLERANLVGAIVGPGSVSRRPGISSDGEPDDTGAVATRSAAPPVEPFGATASAASHGDARPPPSAAAGGLGSNARVERANLAAAIAAPGNRFRPHAAPSDGPRDEAGPKADLRPVDFPASPPRRDGPGREPSATPAQTPVPAIEPKRAGGDGSAPNGAPPPPAVAIGVPPRPSNVAEIIPGPGAQGGPGGGSSVAEASRAKIDRAAVEPPAKIDGPPVEAAAETDEPTVEAPAEAPAMSAGSDRPETAKAVAAPKDALIGDKITAIPPPPTEPDAEERKAVPLRPRGGGEQPDRDRAEAERARTEPPVMPIVSSLLEARAAADGGSIAPQSPALAETNIHDADFQQEEKFYSYETRDIAVLALYSTQVASKPRHEKEKLLDLLARYNRNIFGPGVRIPMATTKNAIIAGFENPTDALQCGSLYIDMFQNMHVESYVAINWGTATIRIDPTNERHDEIISNSISLAARLMPVGTLGEVLVLEELYANPMTVRDRFIFERVERKWKVASDPAGSDVDVICYRVRSKQPPVKSRPVLKLAAGTDVGS